INGLHGRLAALGVDAAANALRAHLIGYGFAGVALHADLGGGAGPNIGDAGVRAAAVELFRAHADDLFAAANDGTLNAAYANAAALPVAVRGLNPVQRAALVAGLDAAVTAAEAVAVWRHPNLYAAYQAYEAVWNIDNAAAAALIGHAPAGAERNLLAYFENVRGRAAPVNAVDLLIDLNAQLTGGHLVVLAGLDAARAGAVQRHALGRLEAYQNLFAAYQAYEAVWTSDNALAAALIANTPAGGEQNLLAYFEDVRGRAPANAVALLTDLNAEFAAGRHGALMALDGTAVRAAQLAAGARCRELGGGLLAAYQEYVAFCTAAGADLAVRRASLVAAVRAMDPTGEDLLNYFDAAQARLHGGPPLTPLILATDFHANPGALAALDPTQLASARIVVQGRIAALIAWIAAGRRPALFAMGPAAARKLAFDVSLNGRAADLRASIDTVYTSPDDLQIKLVARGVCRDIVEVGRDGKVYDLTTGSAEAQRIIDLQLKYLDPITGAAGDLDNTVTHVSQAHLAAQLADLIDDFNARWRDELSHAGITWEYLVQRANDPAPGNPLLPLHQDLQNILTLFKILNPGVSVKLVDKTDVRQRLLDFNDLGKRDRTGKGARLFALGTQDVTEATYCLLTQKARNIELRFPAAGGLNLVLNTVLRDLHAASGDARLNARPGLDGLNITANTTVPLGELLIQLAEINDRMANPADRLTPIEQIHIINHIMGQVFQQLRVQLNEANAAIVSGGATPANSLALGKARSAMLDFAANYYFLYDSYMSLPAPAPPAAALPPLTLSAGMFPAAPGVGVARLANATAVYNALDAGLKGEMETGGAAAEVARKAAETAHRLHEETSTETMRHAIRPH
ncbi:MAG: hypothetical protein ACHP6H_04315, partial [Legionellales bacterium]